MVRPRERTTVAHESHDPFALRPEEPLNFQGAGADIPLQESTANDRTRNHVSTESPTADHDPTDDAGSGNASQRSSNDGPALRVLLVGDGAAMPKIRLHLDDGVNAGLYQVHQVDTIADGFGAIVAAESDVYVVDHHVGARTGFDLLTRIAEDGIKVPIVFVAGAGDHGTGVTAVAAGAACYIVDDALDSDRLEQCIVCLLYTSDAADEYHRG